jgi:hypothetical protein
MTTRDFLTALFCQGDDHLSGLPQHPHATLWPSAIVTLGSLQALQGVGNRAFSRWLRRDSRALFPRLPERTRLFRLFRPHQAWTQVFLAAPTGLGVMDTYGSELIHPRREGRRPQQIGRKGVLTHRWMVGGTLCLVLNPWGGGGGLGVGDRPWRGYPLSVADAAVRSADDWPQGYRLPCGGGRSRQPQAVSARRVGGPPAGGDGVLDADAGQSLHEGEASGLGVLSGAAGLPHGRLHWARPVAWLPPQRVGLRAPLDG